MGWINNAWKAERKAEEEVGEIIVGEILSAGRTQDTIAGFEDAKGYWPRKWVTSRCKEWLPWRVIKDLCANNNLNELRRKCHPHPPDKQQGQQTPWFQSPKTLNREPSQIWASDLQNLWAKKFVLFKASMFVVICWGRSRKPMQSSGMYMTHKSWCLQREE